MQAHAQTQADTDTDTDRTRWELNQNKVNKLCAKILIARVQRPTDNNVAGLSIPVSAIKFRVPSVSN